MGEGVSLRSGSLPPITLPTPGGVSCLAGGHWRWKNLQDSVSGHLSVWRGRVWGQEQGWGLPKEAAPDRGFLLPPPPPRLAADGPGVKVLHVDVTVGRRLPLTPQQQAFLGRGFWAGMGVSVCGGQSGGPAGSPSPPPRRSPSTEMSWMAKRRMMVQIMPSVIFALPSTISARGERGRG